MLKLRSNQIEIFERRAFDALKLRIEQAIGRTFPELAFGAALPGGQPQPSLGEFVEQGIEKAVALDLQRAPEIAGFIALMLALWLQPPREPADWMKPWLERPETAGDMRLEMIGFQIRQNGAADPALRNAAERMAKARQAAAT